MQGVWDVAGGVGNGGKELFDAGYTDIDGMDPVKGSLEIARGRGLYRRTLAEVISADGRTTVGDGEYGAVVCCAGFFQGLISPGGLKELVRITESGGVIIWNIAAGYEHYGGGYDRFVEIVADAEKAQKWKHFR